jgi:hypothetical protein
MQKNVASPSGGGGGGKRVPKEKRLEPDQASICPVLLEVFFKMQTVGLTGPNTGALAKIWAVLSPSHVHKGRQRLSL